MATTLPHSTVERAANKVVEYLGCKHEDGQYRKFWKFVGSDYELVKFNVPVAENGEWKLRDNVARTIEQIAGPYGDAIIKAIEAKRNADGNSN